MRNIGLRTCRSKGVIIFSSIVLALSIGLILLFALTPQDKPIAIVVFVFCGIFSLAALILLLTQLLNYAEVNGDYFISNILFVKRKIKISKIGQIKNVKEVYFVFDKAGKKFATFNSFDPMSGQIIHYLEKRGVKVS